MNLCGLAPKVVLPPKRPDNDSQQHLRFAERHGVWFDSRDGSELRSK